MERAALVTGIRPAILHALEAGDSQALPKGPHACLILASYARFLGLDADRLVAQFKSSVTPERALPARGLRRQGVLLNRLPSLSSPHRPARIAVMAGIAALYLGALSYVWMNFAIAEPRQARSAQVAELPVPPRPPEGVARPIPPGEGLPPLRQASAPAAAGATGTAAPAPLPASQRQGRRIELRAVANVRVSIREPRSSRPILERALRNGETLVVPNREWLRLDVSSAQNLLVLVNGEPDPSLLGGRRGQARGIQLTAGPNATMYADSRN